MLTRLCNPSLGRSFFLFGARGTGKTTLLKQLIPSEECLSINLLLPTQYDEYALNPEALVAQAKALPKHVKWVLIDEVQKLPRLLDVVHHLIEETELKFALTGSSARKLKRKGVNLLAGRASVYHLFPLTHGELGEQFLLDHVLQWGSMPGLLDIKRTEDAREYLEAYAHTYLKEEIGEEQAVRRLEPFRKFLAVAAQSNTKIVNYKRIADDVGTSAVTVKSYFQILEDTLLGFFLEPYHSSVRKSQRQSPKFYFIDAGLERALNRTLDVPLKEGSYAYGVAFEAFVINEIYRLISYKRKNYTLSYVRTKDDAEIDLIIDRATKPPLLIEIKSARRVLETDATTLARFTNDMKAEKAFILSQDSTRKKFKNVLALPWREGIDEIFQA